MWQHNYEPLGSVGVSALAAAIPILVLFFMIGVRRKPTSMTTMTNSRWRWVRDLNGIHYDRIYRMTWFRGRHGHDCWHVGLESRPVVGRRSFYQRTCV